MDKGDRLFPLKHYGSLNLFSNLKKQLQDPIVPQLKSILRFECDVHQGLLTSSPLQ